MFVQRAFLISGVTIACCHFGAHITEPSGSSTHQVCAEGLKPDSHFSHSNTSMGPMWSDNKRPETSAKRMAIMQDQATPCSMWQEPGGESLKSSSPAELQGLKKELVKTLTEAVAMLEAERQIGSASLTDLIVVHSQLLNAKLEVADTKTERVKLLEGSVELWKSLEREAEVRVEVGTLRPTTLLLFRAQRLNAEIALATEKGR